MRISSCKVNNKVCFKARVKFFEALIKGLKIGLIIASIGKTQIKIAIFLFKGKIIFTMYRESKDRGIVLQNRCSAITLMNILINNGDLEVRADFFLECTSGNCGVIKYAKSAAKITVGVVCASSKIPRYAFTYSSLSCSDGGPCRTS